MHLHRGSTFIKIYFRERPSGRPSGRPSRSPLSSGERPRGSPLSSGERPRGSPLSSEERPRGSPLSSRERPRGSPLRIRGTRKEHPYSPAFAWATAGKPTIAQAKAGKPTIALAKAALFRLDHLLRGTVRCRFQFVIHHTNGVQQRFINCDTVVSFSELAILCVY